MIYFLVSLFSLSSFATESCFRVYFVKRPVALGAVYHEYLVVESDDLKDTRALGYLKGNEDLKQFLKARADAFRSDLRVSFLGKFCASKAERALLEASEYQREWTEYYDNNLILYYTRMGVTPLIGKPCRNIALGIAELFQLYFE